MSIPNTSEKSVDLDRQENLTKGNLSAKKVAIYYYDADTDTLKPGIGGDITISGTGLATEDKQDDIITEIQDSNKQGDVFNQTIIGTRNNQIELDFSGTDPDTISILTVTKTNGGDAATSNGQAVFSTSSNANGEIKAVTTRTVTYHSHSENYAAFSGIFTAGVANSFMRIGLYDDNNGFFIGYEGTSFGVTKRTNAVDTTIAKGNWNIDTLTGGSTSKFTRGGTPEAIDLTKDNLYRIRYGWLGAAPVYFEVLSPDGDWVTFHIIRHPNSATVPTIEEPNQPLRLHIKKTSADSTDLSIKSACWAAGTSSDLAKITSTLYDETLAKTVRAVITGQTTAGGGGYVNVKVNPSGAMVTATTIDNGDPTVMYKISDLDSASDPKYYGFLDPSGNWYIMKESTSAGTYRYVSGTSSYSTNWTNRASLTYGYFDGAF